MKPLEHFGLKQKNADKEIVGNLVVLMKEMHWTLEDVKQTPISTILIIGEELSEMNKQMEKDMRKK